MISWINSLDQFSASEQESDDVDDALDGEIGFTYMKEFPTSLNPLTDPNVWICDTGSSSQTSGHNCGMIKLRETKQGDHITGMNGKQEQSTMIAKIPGTVCNKYNNEIRKEAINEVTHVPTSQYNLLSATKLILQCYSM
eukprot:10243715-Ditylum_brightwellii.AAC.1